MLASQVLVFLYLRDGIYSCRCITVSSYSTLLALHTLSWCLIFTPLWHCTHQLLYQSMPFTPMAKICAGFSMVWQKTHSQMGLRSARDSTAISVNGRKGPVDTWKGETIFLFDFFYWFAYEMTSLNRPIMGKRWYL